MKRRITKTQFMAALQEYADNEGHSFDEFSREMTWMGFKHNKPRPDKGENATEQTVWLSVLKINQPDEDDFVEIEKTS